MNLKYILNDYLDFLEEKGIKFPEKYTYKDNDIMLQKIKITLEDVDYDFVLDIIDDFYDALKLDIEKAQGKMCVKFGNRIVVGKIAKINYDEIDATKIKSIDLVDKTNKSMNIKFQMIYSIEEPKKAEVVKKEKKVAPAKKVPEKHVIRDKHKYDEFIEPDLLTTRQIAIVDKVEYMEQKPSLFSLIFSKAGAIALVCIILAGAAIFAIKSTYSVINERNDDNKIVCRDGYENIGGECIIVTTKDASENLTPEEIAASIGGYFKQYITEE